MLQDQLGHVHLASLKFISRCKEVKILEAMTICFGLESISSLHILNIVIDFVCLEVVNMLNDDIVDLIEVSFFIAKAKDLGDNLGISFLSCSR